MIFLKNDYSCGAHPSVLKALNDTNMENTDGYCIDPYCEKAADTIRKLFETENMDVHFLMAGTQTNLAALASFLRPHHAVIAPETGHICVHEAGAIEATGHKVIHCKTSDGKLRPGDIEEVIAMREDEHWVLPKIIYISNLTETGLYYTKKELYDLRKTCDKHNLWIYLDGARLPMALGCAGNDVEFTDIAAISDAFYLGGTKCGILFGEALCILNDDLKEDTRCLLKQRGAILAKGRLLGVQFDAILKDDLYFKLGRKANELAEALADGIAKRGFDFDVPPQSNLIFPIFSDELVDKLSKEVMFEPWRDYNDGRKSIRLVTSWSSTQEDVDEFLKLIS